MSYHLVSDPTVKRWSLWPSLREKVPKQLTERRWLIAGISSVALVFSLFAVSVFVSQKQHGVANATTPITYPEDTAVKPDEKPGYLHLIIPASRPDHDLGKNLLSATILGYPTPSLMNWGLTFNDSKLVEGGTHLAKITGLLRFLHELDASRPDDLVLMVDGYDIWFQLRPQVLIERYFAANKAADARTKELYGDARDGKGIRHRTIMSSEKRCFNFDEREPACTAVPQSPLPPDIYGPETDTVTPDGDYRHMRQRYLNSGVILGTVESLKHIFTRAEALARKDPNYGSDQHILSIILAEQELWRKDPKRKTRQPGESDESYYRDEYGLVLDYESRLSQPTVNAEMDTWWVTHSRPWTIAEAKRELNITPSNDNMLRMEPDLAASKPPFSLLTDEQLHAPGPGNTVEQQRNRSWADVALYTNAWTGAVPAIIHHNGDKAARWRMWPLVWYQRSARELFEAARKRVDHAPLAFVDGKHWLPSGVKNVGGARLEKNGTDWVDVSWEEVCDDECSTEVFRVEANVRP